MTGVLQKTCQLHRTGEPIVQLELRVRPPNVSDEVTFGGGNHYTTGYQEQPEGGEDELPPVPTMRDDAGGAGLFRIVASDGWSEFPAISLLAGNLRGEWFVVDCAHRQSGRSMNDRSEAPQYRHRAGNIVTLSPYKV
jgi:hypothetical protein